MTEVTKKVKKYIKSIEGDFLFTDGSPKNIKKWTKMIDDFCTENISIPIQKIEIKYNEDIAGINGSILYEYNGQDTITDFTISAKGE